jgi:hypothetical protein
VRIVIPFLDQEIGISFQNIYLSFIASASNSARGVLLSRVASCGIGSGSPLDDST